MIDPRQLAFSVTAPDGYITRWGGDEPDAHDVPTGIGFSTKIPGGHNSLNASLPRPLTVDFPDLLRFSPVRCYGQGNLSAFEGYIESAPRSHGADFSITPGVVGWAAHLRDDPSFREIYRDIDLSRWRGPSVQRRAQYAAVSSGIEGPSVEADVTTGNPALRTGFVGNWAAFQGGEAWYDALGISLGSLYYGWTRGSTVNAADPQWIWRAHLRDQDLDAGGVDQTADLRATGPGGGTLTATGTRTFAHLLLSYGVAAGGANLGYDILWTTLAVYGAHGLTKRGTEPNVGFFGSDVIAHIVSRAAPLLNYTTGDSGSIQTTNFAIPHLTFLELTTGEDAITAVNRFDLYDWGVYDDKKFFYRPTGLGTLWRLRIGGGVRVEEEGPQAETSFNGVVVGYTDASGRSKFVGPTGFTGGTAYATLADTSSTNPLNAFGRRKWARLDMGLTTEAGAVQVGYLFMQEIATRETRGSVVVTGTATDSNGVTWPAWRIRAGDRVVLEDTNDRSERVIIDTSYIHDSLELTANLDAPANKLDALLERLDVVLMNV